MQEIYLDNAATINSYGNPSSVHSFGFLAEKLLKNARLDLLKIMGADERNYTLTFTSSGTEADNLAVLGYARLMTKKGNRILMGNSEHPAVFGLKDELEKIGYEVILIPNFKGNVDFDFVRENLNDKTVLITHMMINNETGTLYDIKKLCRIRDELSPKCLVHTDAVQAFLKTDRKLTFCGADMISVSSHKIHGPKGVGALLCKKGVRLSPVVLGGGQESGLRSGTEPLPLICAFANSAKILDSTINDNLRHIESLNIYAKELISKTIPEAIINQAESFSPYILSITFPKIKSEVMLRYLSEKGIYISAGSACSSKHKENRVLTNFGIPDTFADCTVRISFCENNTTDEIDAFVTAALEGYSSLAKIR